MTFFPKMFFNNIFEISLVNKKLLCAYLSLENKIKTFNICKWPSHCNDYVNPKNVNTQTCSITINIWFREINFVKEDSAIKLIAPDYANMLPINKVCWSPVMSSKSVPNWQSGSIGAIRRWDWWRLMFVKGLCSRWVLLTYISLVYHHRNE